MDRSKRSAIRSALPDSGGKISQTARNGTGPSLTDQQLQKTVRRFLQDDPRTRPFADSALVQNGCAILSGRTYLSSSRDLAATTAAQVRGIVAVQNLIVVEPNSDLEIARKLHDAFSRDTVIDDAAIGVTVFHGKVFLSGTADSADEVARVNQIAYSTPGVESVSNGLQVSAQPRRPSVRTPATLRSYTSTRPGYR